MGPRSDHHALPRFDPTIHPPTTHILTSQALLKDGQPLRSDDAPLSASGVGDNDFLFLMRGAVRPPPGSSPRPMPPSPKIDPHPTQNFTPSQTQHASQAARGSNGGGNGGSAAAAGGGAGGLRSLRDLPPNALTDPQALITHVKGNPMLLRVGMHARA